jgi:hypothetical protein
MYRRFDMCGSYELSEKQQARENARTALRESVIDSMWKLSDGDISTTQYIANTVSAVLVYERDIREADGLPDVVETDVVENDIEHEDDVLMRSDDLLRLGVPF